MEIRVPGSIQQSDRFSLPPTYTGRLARFAELREQRQALQRYSRFVHLRPAAPIETRFSLEEREETDGMKATAPREAIATPPTGDQDPFRGAKKLGEVVAKSWRRFASQVSEGFSQGAQQNPAQIDTIDAGDTLEETAKRAAVKPAALQPEPVLDQDIKAEEDSDLAVTAPQKTVKVSGFRSAFARMKSMGAQALESIRAGLSQPKADAEGVEPAVDEIVLDQNTGGAQVTATDPDANNEATQRLTPDARARRASQPNPLNTPTQRLVGLNGTLHMPTARQPMPGAQMIVGGPGDSAFHNAPTTQHAVSQPLAQPAQPQKLTLRQKLADARARIQEGFNETAKK